MLPALNAIRLLALTGCRLSEIQKLRWEHVREATLELPDGKNGARRVYLGPAAVEGPSLDRALARQPLRDHRASDLVAHLTDLQRPVAADPGPRQICRMSASTTFGIPSPPEALRERREPAGDRQAVGPQASADDGALRARSPTSHCARPPIASAPRSQHHWGLGNVSSQIASVIGMSCQRARSLHSLRGCIPRHRRDNLRKIANDFKINQSGESSTNLAHDLAEDYYQGSHNQRTICCILPKQRKVFKRAIVDGSQVRRDIEEIFRKPSIILSFGMSRILPVGGDLEKDRP